MYPTFDWDNRLSERIRRVPASEIREVLKVISRPDITSFAGGVPDPQLFPSTALIDALSASLADPSRRAEALQYSKSEGYDPLRRWVGEMLGRSGAPLGLESVMITTGAQQALDLLCKTLVNPGDRVIVAAPTYLGALQTFSVYGPQFVSVQSDDHGMIPSALEEALKLGAAMIYVIPDFQNPTGITLSAERRRQIVALSAQYRVPVVEDTAYRFLRYEGEEQPPVIASGEPGKAAPNVINVGTVSKILAPGFRVGWVAGDPGLIARVVIAKQTDDLCVSTLIQMAVLDLLGDGFPAHLAMLRQTYGARRDAMLAALRQHMPPGISWTTPAGGLFVWLTLPPELDGHAVCLRAIDEAKVAAVPGASFFADRSGTNTLRLSFSTNPPEIINDGISRLGRVMAGMLDAAPRAKAS